LNGVLSLMQLSLIDGMTFGLSPFVFALGDDAFAQFVSGIQFLVSLYPSFYTFSLVPFQ
jgi:hypothetical protein